MKKFNAEMEKIRRAALANKKKTSRSDAFPSPSKSPQSTFEAPKHESSVYDLCVHPLAVAIRLDLLGAFWQQYYVQQRKIELFDPLDEHLNTVLHFCVYYGRVGIADSVISVVGKSWPRLVNSKNALGQKPSQVIPQEESDPSIEGSTNSNLKNRLTALEALADAQAKKRKHRSSFLNRMNWLRILSLLLTFGLLFGCMWQVTDWTDCKWLTTFEFGVICFVGTVFLSLSLQPHTFMIVGSASICALRLFFCLAWSITGVFFVATMIILHINSGKMIAKTCVFILKGSSFIFKWVCFPGTYLVDALAYICSGKYLLQESTTALLKKTMLANSTCRYRRKCIKYFFSGLESGYFTNLVEYMCALATFFSLFSGLEYVLHAIGL